MGARSSASADLCARVDPLPEQLAGMSGEHRIVCDKPTDCTDAGTPACAPVQTCVYENSSVLMQKAQANEISGAPASAPAQTRMYEIGNVLMHRAQAAGIRAHLLQHQRTKP